LRGTAPAMAFCSGTGAFARSRMHSLEDDVCRVPGGVLSDKNEIIDKRLYTWENYTLAWEVGHESIEI
jgi:hypothetical protein